MVKIKIMKDRTVEEKKWDSRREKAKEFKKDHDPLQAKEGIYQE